MEFSTDGGTTWTTYNNNLPDPTGNVTFLVHVKDTTTHKAGKQVTLTFTQDSLCGTATITVCNVVGSQLTVGISIITCKSASATY